MSVNQEPLLNPADPEMESFSAASDEAIVRKRRGYPVLLGHTWSHDLVDVLVDQYFPLIDRGYELDGLVNHFIGGQGFEFDHPFMASSDQTDRL